MPELPEVETIVRELDRVLSGKKITAVSVLRAKSFIGDEKELVGKTIESVERRSKMTVVGFSHYPKKLVIHLIRQRRLDIMKIMKKLFRRLRG